MTLRRAQGDRIGTGARVVRMAAAIGEIDAAALTAPGRSNREISELRFAVMLALSEFDHSSPKIGRLLGGRDHSGVLYGIEKAQKLAALDPEYAWLVDALRAAARRTVHPAQWQPLNPALVAQFVPPAVSAPAEPVAALDVSEGEDDEPDPVELNQRRRERAKMAAASARLLAALRQMGSSYKAVSPSPAAAQGLAA